MDIVDLKVYIAELKPKSTNGYQIINPKLPSSRYVKPFLDAK